MLNSRLNGALVATFLCLAPLGLAESVVAQVRVGSWNVARLWGDMDALEYAIVELASDEKPGFASAPSILAFQEVRSSNAAQLQAIIANAIPDVTYTTATFTSSGSEDGSGGAQILFYRADLFTEVLSGHADIFTGAGRNADRWQLRLTGSTDDAGVIWVYSCHLKASQGSENEDERLDGAIAIRNNAATLPAGANVIYVGDYNVYSNNELAYLKMIEAGSNRGVDPLGAGSWSGSGNSIKHTQSPRLPQTSNLVGGGIDDRFDIQFFSEPLDDGEGFSLMPGTYRCMGNDGNHYNESVNDGNNTYYPTDVPRSNALADALFEASDHMPVLSDFTIPGFLSCVLSSNLGNVVSGGSASVNLLVANSRSVEVPEAAAQLEYSWSGDDVLLGSGSNSAPLLPSFQVEAMSLAAGLEGEFSAIVTVDATSPGVSTPSYSLNTFGTAVRAANPSFDGRKDLDVFTVETDTPPDSGAIVIEVSVYNHGWDALQAAMDIDNSSGLSGRFFAVDGFDSGITIDPAVMRFGFLSDGATKGVYEGITTISTSDEDIPGETTHSITLTLKVTVGESDNPADINGDGVVDGADLGSLLAAWGPCSRPCPADLNGDGVVDGADLGMLLAGWV